MTDETSRNAVELTSIAEDTERGEYQGKQMELQRIQEDILSVQTQIAEESSKLLRLKKELESIRHNNIDMQKHIKEEKAKCMFEGMPVNGTTSQGSVSPLGSPERGRQSMFVQSHLRRNSRSDSRNSSMSGVPKLHLNMKRSDKFDMRKDLLDARIRRIERHHRHSSAASKTTNVTKNLSSVSVPSIVSDSNDIDKPSVRKKVRKILSTSPKSRNDSHLSYLANVFETVGISFKRHEEKSPNQDLMKKFCRHARSELFRARARVFSQGDAAEEYFVVLTGSVEVLVKDVVTKTDKVVTVLKPGAMFGELGLTHDTARTATVVAVQETELVVLDKKNYLKIFCRPRGRVC